jgi:tetratricopeptide (TPR) repeat protein
MQKLQYLAAASYTEKLEALKTFGGHPYALVTLDRYCNHQPLSRALEDAKNIHADLRAFLAIELNYAQLSERSSELLNRLAAFRQPVPYEGAEWVMGKKFSYVAEILEENRDSLPEQWKALDDAEVMKRLEKLLPERRQAEDLPYPIKELVEWGLLTPLQVDGQTTGLSVHALVRDFCNEKQQGGTWRQRLRDAAAFYTNHTKLIQQEDKSQAEIWIEMEAFELLMEAEDFNGAAKLLMGTTPLLARWGFGQYLEGQYRRLLGKPIPQATAIILYNYGALIEERGDYETALTYYEQSLKISEEFGDRLGIASSLSQIGNIYYRRGKYNKALENYEQALEISEELGNRSGIAVSLHKIGMIYESQDEYDKALEYYDHSLKISEELGNRSDIADLLHQMGNLHNSREEHDKALEYYDHSLKISEELGYRVMVAYSLGQIGLIHHLRSDYETALNNYEQVLNISEEIGDRYSIGNSLNQIGKLFVDVGRYDEAFKNLLSALTIFIDLQSPNGGLTINALKELRSKWHEENFNAAWKEATGGDVPDWLKEE